MNSHSRFSNISCDVIDLEIQKSVPINTVKTHKSVWIQFSAFCKSKGYCLKKDTKVEELAVIMKDWGFNMRKKDGTEYKEGVVKIMWNTVAKKLQEMYYVQHNVAFDPFKDITFKSARDARDAKRRILQQSPNTRKESSSALSVEEHMKIVELWDENTPEGLQKKFYHIIAVELAWRGAEATNCLLTYFKEEVDHEGNPTGRIKYTPVFTKTTQGGDKKLTESKWLVANATNTEICPVRLFKKLLSKRGGNINTDRLFLTPNPFWMLPENAGWYKNCPIGKNQIAKWTHEAAQKIGIDKAKITNRSNRLTAVSKLAKRRVQEQELSYASSTESCLQMDPTRHPAVVNKMRNMQNIQTTSPLTTSYIILTSGPSSSAKSSSLHTVSPNINSKNTNKDQGKSEPPEPPQFENIYIDASNEQEVDIKEEIFDTEESFSTLTTEKIMQAIDYDKNGHSIEQQMNLMEENVFIKSEDILEDLNLKTSTDPFDVHIKNEVMDIKDEDIVNEDYLNQRLANVSIPVIEVGFSEANSNNLPKVDLLTIMDYFHKNDNSIFSEIKRLKSEPLIGRTNYEDSTVGYVQVKHEPYFCEIKASVTPENDATTNNCDVSYTINTMTNLVTKAACLSCPGNEGGCIHCVAFLMWLHRRSLEPSPTEEVSYWKKPVLKDNQIRKNVTEDQSVKRKVDAEVPQGCKKRKIQDNIDTYHNPEFNSLSIQCLATSFKKCTLTKNAKNFQKFSELHLNPELIVHVEEVTRDQSQSSLWQEMRYARVPSSKAYDVIRSKTVDASLEEDFLANVCDSEAISLKLERKNKVLKMLSSETSMQFFKTGIFLSSETPFVEATPDAINDTFVVEIKCPKMEKSLNEYLDSDGNMKLKYFYQMQLQMRLTKKEKGIFVIAHENFESSEKLITSYCDYDEYFANTILNGINEFWTRNIYSKVL